MLAFQFSSFGQDTINYIPDTSKSARNSPSRDSRKPHILGYATPALLLSYGLISLENKPVRRLDKYVSYDLLGSNTNFTTEVDDYFRYLPVVVVYSLNAFGIKGKSNFIDRSALYLISNLLLSKSVDFLTDETQRERPSKTDFRAFPSGHTALAFGAAEFMRREYKDVSPWYGYSAYAAAAATGAIKILENAHWLSDVLTGAGVGILSTRVAYYVYPIGKEIAGGRKDLQFRTVPFLGKGLIGASVTVTFK